MDINWDSPTPGDVVVVPVVAVAVVLLAACLTCIVYNWVRWMRGECGAPRGDDGYAAVELAETGSTTSTDSL